METISSLTVQNRRTHSPDIEAGLVRLRMEAARAGSRAALDSAAGAACGREDLFPDIAGLPEISRDRLDADTVAAGILRHGALIVRGLYDAGQIRRLEEAAAAEEAGGSARDEHLGCSPHTLFELLEIYGETGLLGAVGRYLGEQPVLFGERVKLRWHDRERDSYAAIPWHQDGAFFGGRFRAVNCWAAVTPCGEDNPGLSVIPRRFEDFYGWNPREGHAPLDYGRSVSSREFDELLSACAPVDCILQPGDAVLFDEMTVHQTMLRPWKRRDQLVTISWFFGASRFPAWGTPLAV